MLHRHIKNIAVKNPCSFIIPQRKHYFINDLQRTHFEAGKFPEHFIMISGNIIDFHFFINPVQNVLYNFHVAFWPVSFIELPHINNIAVENYCLWFYAFHVAKKLGGIATKSSEMYIA